MTRALPLAGALRLAGALPVAGALPLAGALAVAAVVAGCGGGNRTAGAASAGATAPLVSAPTAATPPRRASARTAATPPRPGSLVKVARTRFGRILVDRRGQALYLFTKDRRGPSRCYVDCASAWPPLYTSGHPVAGRDAIGDKLGTVRRRDGRLQVTYGGQPLYHFAGDSPGRILCQDAFEFGGTWLVVKPSGVPVR